MMSWAWDLWTHQYCPCPYSLSSEAPEREAITGVCSLGSFICSWQTSKGKSAHKFGAKASAMIKMLTSHPWTLEGRGVGGAGSVCWPRKRLCISRSEGRPWLVFHPGSLLLHEIILRVMGLLVWFSNTLISLHDLLASMISGKKSDGRKSLFLCR